MSEWRNVRSRPGKPCYPVGVQPCGSEPTAGDGLVAAEVPGMRITRNPEEAMERGDEKIEHEGHIQ